MARARASARARLPAVTGLGLCAQVCGSHTLARGRERRCSASPVLGPRGSPQSVGAALACVRAKPRGACSPPRAGVTALRAPLRSHERGHWPPAAAPARLRFRSEVGTPRLRRARTRKRADTRPCRRCSRPCCRRALQGVATHAGSAARPGPYGTVRRLWTFTRAARCFPAPTPDAAFESLVAAAVGGQTRLPRGQHVVAPMARRWHPCFCAPSFLGAAAGACATGRCDMQ